MSLKDLIPSSSPIAFSSAKDRRLMPICPESSLVLKGLSPGMINK